MINTSLKARIFLTGALITYNNNNNNLSIIIIIIIIIITIIYSLSTGVKIIVSHKIESSQLRANKSKDYIYISFGNNVINFKILWLKDIIMNDMLSEEIIKNFASKLAHPKL
jgi:hypothetical protein